jgi:uncharacterized membrane protein YhaH (DUF805 family)
MSPATYLFSFTGRINRAKLWLFFLISIATYFVLALLAFMLIGFAAFAGATQGSVNALAAGGLGAVLFLLIGFATFVVFLIAAISLSIRRLHDRDKSGLWLLLFWLAPLCINLMAQAIAFNTPTQINPVGALLTLVAFGISIWGFVELYCLRGTVGQNRFGADPIDPAANALVFE